MPSTKSQPKWPYGRVLVVAGALVLAVALLALRMVVRRTWHVPAGDGVQYFQLAHELWARRRLALGPPPMPITYARLPGYPIFIALFGDPRGMEVHLVRATVLNQVLDALTALFVVLIAVERRLGVAVGAVAAVLVLGCPIIAFASCYGMTESLCTCLLAAELYGSVRAMRDGSLVAAALSGVAAGLSQLVRPDAVALVPVALLAVGMAPVLWRQRVRAGLVFGLAAALVFAPWPIRNVVRFGAPYPTGAPAWEKVDGTELPTGMLSWLLTWGTGAPGETYLMLLIANTRPLDMPRNLRPEMWDGDDEKREVMRVFESYNKRLDLRDAEQGFRALAAARTKRDPLRTYLWLPLRRAMTEWSPIPEWEMPMRSTMLRLPEERDNYGRVERGLFVVGVLGLVLLLFADRRLALLLALAVATRTLLFAYLIPFPVERYMVEAVPPLLLGTAFALSVLVTRRLRN